MPGRDCCWTKTPSSTSTHRPQPPLAVRQSASCAPIAHVTDARVTHYHIVALAVENMADEANKYIQEAEEYESDGLDFPKELILNLIKAAKELHSLLENLDDDEKEPVIEAIRSIRHIFLRGVTHECEASEDSENDGCAMCKGIDEVKAMQV